MFNTMRSVAFTIAGLCIALQLFSATFLITRFDTPNGSTELAQNLVRTERYEIAVRTGPPWKAFLLPGEPLYLAFGFSHFPPSASRYLHLPIVLAFVLALTFVAARIGGPKLALAAGVLACLDPFLVGHGPVWDDTFLAAAAEWSMFAVLTAAGFQSDLRRRTQLLVFAVLTILSGCAAITRTQSQIIIGVVGLSLIAAPGFAKVRRFGAALVLGVMIATSAWGIRNVGALGAFFIGSSHDGQTLHQSNYANARESIVRTGVAQSYAPIRTPPGVTGELDAERYYRHEALSYLASNPLDALETSALKVVVSLTGYDFPAGPWSSRNLLLVIVNVALLVLGGRGVVRLRANSKRSGLYQLARTWVVVMAGSTFVMLVLGPVGLRYRISFAGIIYVCAAAELLCVTRQAEITS